MTFPIRFLVLLALMAAAFVCAPRNGRIFAQQQNNTPKTFTGEIMDADCAASGSHDDMMKKEGVKDAKACTRMCVQNGSKFVLYVVTDRAAYLLDDQYKPRDYAGQRVNIMGTYDGATRTIHIQSIQVVR
jgi:hypothetical protein